ncbi:MAG: hypothetical protein QOG23_2806 [Blastocatellia bacterium]|nr:hypothetical protein [Blastocatellia bacterium]
MKEGRRARPRNGVPLRTRLDPNVGSPRHPELFFSVNRGELSLGFLSATRNDHWLDCSSSLVTRSGLRCISAREAFDTLKWTASLSVGVEIVPAWVSSY